jgi:EAL domain-containing protein (putative c-di-GMP-specific phosphodiesterase class I)/DNA-binding response OmpR family regulator
LVPVDVSDSTIYVADDVAANRALLEAILGAGGLRRVHGFEDGERLLRAIAAREPDLIMLDLRMPGMNGVEVLERLEDRRAGNHFLPVIVLTADGASESRRTALASGANDYVTKPFDADEVLLRARNLLQIRRMHLALEAHNADLLHQIDDATRSLSRREREWADVALSLTQLEERDSVEATAQAICDELGKIRGLMGVTVTAIDAAGQAVPLAHDGPGDLRIGVNRALPRDVTNRWRERVGAKPWIGPWEPGFGSFMNGIPPDQPTAMVVIPLRTSRGMVGGLSAATAMPDGTAYLAERLPMLESFGAVASALLARGILERQERGAVRRELQRILGETAFRPVFQPIVDLASGATVGFEALTRFADGVRPDRRFADAAAVGLGIELEAATLSAAVAASEALPDEAWLSLNVSPAMLTETARLARAVGSTQRRLVLEITEHVAIDDYQEFRASVKALGQDLLYAVDDAGAGYSSFRHILELRPHFVKLDIGMVHEIDRDDIRQALVAGIVYFARRSRCRIIAEGIETPGERDTLRGLGVDLGQGFLLGRPVAVSAQERGRASGLPPPVLDEAAAGSPR